MPDSSPICGHQFSYNEGVNAETRRRGNWWYCFITWLVREVIYRATGGLRIQGLEHIPHDGPAIIVANHMSYLDPPALGTPPRRWVRAMAKEELFKGPLGWLLHSIGTHPVRRGSSDTDSIKWFIEQMKQNSLVLMFPEGTRGDGETMGEFQSGVFMLSRRASAPIIPAGIRGTEIMWPRGSKKFRRHRITIVYTAPIAPEDIPRDKVQACRMLAERIADATELAGKRIGLPPSMQEAHLPLAGEHDAPHDDALSGQEHH